jgi:hypothetical protein
VALIVQIQAIVRLPMKHVAHLGGVRLFYEVEFLTLIRPIYIA